MVGGWSQGFGDDLRALELIASSAGDDEVSNGCCSAEVPGVNVVYMEGVVSDLATAVLALAVIAFIDSLP